ncbi:hypothetical protein B296_00041641 [Ensete ventricosum]|uniref:Uncharacterized protein n=1 Tax=Ensete ventricosum TaxID=4639 RepID=A0A426ZIB0_ENSVE|nr:hypothetical protein B296_00041641 [Ensete ventricosum]
MMHLTRAFAIRAEITRVSSWYRYSSSPDLKVISGSCDLRESVESEESVWIWHTVDRGVRGGRMPPNRVAPKWSYFGLMVRLLGKLWDIGDNSSEHPGYGLNLIGEPQEGFGDYH